MDIVIEQYNGEYVHIRQQDFKVVYILQDEPLKTVISHVLEEQLGEVSGKVGVSHFKYGVVIEKLEDHFQRIHDKEKGCGG